jgi:hypothetical protein
MPWARASQLDRFLECSAASWLPRWDDASGLLNRPYLGRSMPTPVEALMVKRDTRARDIGNEGHARVEAGEHAELWAGLDDKGQHEVAMSYCCKTGRARMQWGLDKRRRD